MFRNKATYILIIILLLFVAIIVLEYFSPRQVDWTETFDNDSKSPLGCYVVNELLPDIFPNQPIVHNNASFYESLDTVATRKNLVVITSQFEPDPESFKVLLRFAAKGNSVFIAANSFAKQVSDSLKFSVSTQIDSILSKAHRNILRIDHPHLQQKTDYSFPKGFPEVYFSDTDTLHTEKLGTCFGTRPNFIRIKYGQGTIFLHLQPQVFTNYYFLYGNSDYAAVVLSHLAIQPTISDDYYKPFRMADSSPVRYILSQPSLRMAYYLLLLALAFYMIIESKRRQRVIPVVKPLENKSLDFVKTVGNLYFNQRDNSDLARKMIIYFREFLREHYFIQQVNTDEECIARLSDKSGISRDKIRYLLGLISYYETTVRVSNEELIKLNTNIEDFYKHCL